MTSYIIGNTPCGIYRGDLPLGYAYFQTLLDIYARFSQVFKRREIIFPKYSLNALGLRAEQLGLDGTITALNGHVKRFIRQGRLREKMKFISSGEIVDTDPVVVAHTQAVLTLLYNRGYVLRREGVLFFECCGD